MDELQIQLRSTSLALNLGGFDEASKLVLIAAERIASLEAELKQREWISVEDRLPEDYGWFLVIDEFLVCEPQTMGFYEGEDSPVGWIPLDQRADPDSMKVTYWQPIPSPPQEQGK